MKKIIAFGLLLPVAVLSGCKPPDDYYYDFETDTGVSAISSESSEEGSVSESSESSENESSVQSESETDPETETDTSLMWEPAASRLSGGDEQWVAETGNTNGSESLSTTAPGTDVIDVEFEYLEINDNIPEFSEEDILRTDPFETYSELDSRGRCGVAYANICEELMPEEDRAEQIDVDPTGWHSYYFEDIVEDGFLYNRCHLIGYFLAGEGNNERNLITGTRSFNVDGMLPFEIEVGNYVEETGNHVLYRVTPVYTGSNLVADGVQMEAWSVEDNGEGVCFNVYIPNMQPGIVIDYSTGEAWRE